jgi:hypothetical protein
MAHLWLQGTEIFKALIEQFHSLINTQLYMAGGLVELPRKITEKYTLKV